MSTRLREYIRSSRTARAHVVALCLAVLATVGSLYFSLGMGLTPCRLCWYQRILMYPQVLVLGVALYERRTAYRVTLPMTCLGAAIAAYHSYIQVFGGDLCSFVCSSVQYQLFGVLTIPNLSFIAFTGIAVVLGSEYVRTRD